MSVFAKMLAEKVQSYIELRRSLGYAYVNFQQPADGRFFDNREVNPVVFQLNARWIP